jgi:hypothetical protein
VQIGTESQAADLGRDGLERLISRHDKDAGRKPGAFDKTQPAKLR